MEKFNKIIKNVLIFFLIYLAVGWVFNGFQSEEDLASKEGTFEFIASKNEYNRTQKVTLELSNYTDQEILIPNECPGEPFDVYKYENGEWVQVSADPELNCERSQDLVIPAGEQTSIVYENWNHALFSDLGRFRIEFKTEIDGEEKTFTTQEFRVEAEGVLKKLMIGLFYRPIYNALIFIIAVIPGHSLGWGIILLTLLIRTLLLIPSQKAMRSQKKLQEIQPRIEKIKEKYKGDQQKVAMETMAIWKEANISPVSGCLPMLMQFPFLIALFYVVRGGLNPDSTHLLYTTYENFALTNIDVNFLGLLDLTQPNIYVLPIIIGGLQFTQMQLALARKGKKKGKKKGKGDEMAMATNMMSYVMPILIAVFTASLPAGVGIYWGTSTLYGIVQQLIVNKTPGKSDNESEPKVRVINNKD